MMRLASAVQVRKDKPRSVWIAEPDLKSEI